MFSLLGGDAPDYAAQAAKAEKQRQQAIQSGMANIDQVYAGFTPDFYKQRQQAFIDYAMPQLGQQYRDTRNAMNFGLANKGLLRSGAALGQRSNLEQQTLQSKQALIDQGRGQAQGLQQQVADSRNNLISQLYQSADPAGAKQSAISTAASFQQPSAFAPIANQFSGLLNQYYTNQLLNSYRPTSFVQAPGASYGNASALPSASYSAGGGY